VARSISAVFPEIQSIGGVRPDALRWHPDGLALDVMIPDPGSAEGIALGNQIVAFVLKNADRFGIQDALWRDVYYTPAGPQGSGYGHYDHVHITTTGGGYPAGQEIYSRRASIGNGAVRRRSYSQASSSRSRRRTRRLGSHRPVSAAAMFEVRSSS
jgi:hypothetical protein